MNKETLLEALVTRRKQQKLRQVDVAEAMRIGQPSVSELESGRTSPRLATLQSYAEVVGCTISFEISFETINDVQSQI